MTAKVAAMVLAFSAFLMPIPADSAEPKAHTVSLFTIGKSQNKNEVQYAVHLDGQCAPASGAPVFEYWRMLELGPTNVEPILARELSAYGPASQQVTARRADGGEVRLVLRALRNRPIVVETRRAPDGTCRALATLAIARTPAHLFDVYVKLTWRLSVDYLLLRGWSMDGKRVISEKLRP